jgi:tRNA A37 methylthiotransferase MiaB
MPETSTHIRTTRKTAYVETYGCQMNISDGELMQGVLAAGGYDIVTKPEDADVVLVNTCAIREHAEQRVIGRVGELNRLKTERPGMVIGVTGCMAQRLGEKLLESAGHVDLVMGPDGYRELADALARIRSDAPARAVAAHAAVGASPAHPRRELPVLSAADTPTAMGVTGSADTIAPEPAVDRLAVLELKADENYEGLAVRRAPA